MPKSWNEIKTQDSWQIFKIMSEFVEGFDTMAKIGPCVSIFGSARTNEEKKLWKDESTKNQWKNENLELIFKNLKSLFEKRGFVINWRGLEKQSLDETINALAMASPFTIEEKQVLLEAKNLNTRKAKIAEILTTYSFDQFNNTTIQ